MALLGLYSMLVMADSSALTAGTIAAARLEQRGITLALHSTPGFGAGMISPTTLFGWIFDATGGNASTAAWGFAYASQGMFCLLAPLLMLGYPTPSGAKRG